MIKVKNIKPTIYTRDPIYNDWRDWFLEKNIKVKQNTHKTNIEIYIDKSFIHQMLIPINTRKVHCDIEIEVDTTTTIDKLVYIIPEMGIMRETNISVFTTLEPGDIGNLSCELSFMDEN